MKVYVDGDVIVYAAAAGAERKKYLVEYLNGATHDFETAKEAKLTAEVNMGTLWERKVLEPVDNAIENCRTALRTIASDLNVDAKALVVILSGPGNFRHKYATRADYKGNRTGERPTHFNAVREYLIQAGAKVTQGEEADDLLGIMMTRYPGSVCASIDKDLLQIPGWHYNINHREVGAMGHRDADLRFFAQVLSGDATDNIPGLKGIGAVRASAALADCDDPVDCWRVVMSMYGEQFGAKKAFEYARETARLIHIRRRTGQVWNPNKDLGSDVDWLEAIPPCPIKLDQFVEEEVEA